MKNCVIIGMSRRRDININTRSWNISETHVKKNGIYDRKMFALFDIINMRCKTSSNNSLDDTTRKIKFYKD